MVRKHMVGLRLDDEEMELLEEAAQQLGVKVTALLRAAGVEVSAKLLGKEVPSLRDKVRRVLEADDASR